MHSGIYCIRNLLTGKRYIGSATSLPNRLRNHKDALRRNQHFNRHLQRAWNKHGENNFSLEPLVICSKNMLLYYEQRFIDNLYPEYNICRIAGSVIGIKHSEEARKKMAARKIGKPSYVRSESNKLKISMALMGHPVSLETRRKIGQAFKGKTLTDATKKKISEALKGRIRSPEHCLKMSLVNKGRKHTPEARANMLKALKKRLQMKPDKAA